MDYRAYPIKTKSEAHHTVLKLFKDVSVPNKMVMYNANAHVEGTFRKKTEEADCPVRTVEPHSRLSNAAEAPKRLWDDCIEYGSLFCSHTTALNLW